MLKHIKSFKYYYISVAIRLSLLAIGNYQDKNLEVKYTDLDYYVYTDAAQYVLRGGSPYERHTYRYTPLLAYMMIPNILLSSIFGKILFVCSDIICALLIEQILKLSTSYKMETIRGLTSIWLFNPLVCNVSTRGSADTLVSLLILLTIKFLLKQ